MQLVPITNTIMNSDPALGGMYPIQHYVIKFVRLFVYFEENKMNWIIFYSARCTYLRSYYNRNRDFKMNYGNHWDIIKDIQNKISIAVHEE
jgi:hypothetical protein